MQQILEFLKRYRHWFVFILLEVIALTCVLSGSVYARSIAWYATSRVVGQLNEWMTEAWSYMDLRASNERLLLENAQLRHSYTLLSRQMQDAEAHGTLPHLHVTDSLPMSSGAVVADGIETDMGVMSSTGVVGAVMATSRHYALVIPVLNPKIRLSCTLRGQSVSGTLTAPTNPNDNAAVLSGVPPHARPQKGDTIMTSGYSYLFPEGMMVGTVADAKPVRTKGAAGIFANYTVRLATDFQSLRYVYVILAKPSREVKALEDSIATNE